MERMDGFYVKFDTVSEIFRVYPEFYDKIKK